MLLANGARGIHDHEDEKYEHEDDGAHDGDAVEVLLDDARTSLVGVHGACDHIADARSLTGVKKNENDKASARNNQQKNKNDKQSVQSDLFFQI